MKLKLIHLLLIISLASVASCQSTESLSKKPSYKVGQVSFDEVMETSEKFKKGFDRYSPTKKQSISSSYRIVIVFGYWCHDSKREVPRLLKTLKHFGVNESQIELYSTDRKKKQPEETIKKFEVYYSPTIIFYNQDKEVRRFVEFPDTTWENDLIKYCTEKG